MPRPRHSPDSHESIFFYWRLGLLKGFIFKFYWRILTKLGLANIQIGKKFSLMGSLVIRGPGVFILGDDAIIGDRVTAFTYKRSARIEIGNHCFLNGTRFGCTQAIVIGDDCIIADSRLMDTDFHSIAKNRRSPHAQVASAPIQISENVWVAAQSAILKGVQIGPHSVIAYGSVVTGSIGANLIAGGNPAKIIGPVPDSLQFHNEN